MNPTVGGTTTGHRTGLQQAVDAAPQRLSAAQHAKEDQPSPEVPSSPCENERNSGNRACDARKLYASFTNDSGCVVSGSV